MCGRCSLIRALRSAAPLVLLAAALAGVPAAFGGEGEGWTRVRRVIDGDTLEVSGSQRVRLIGVDAPEYRPWDGVVEPYGKRAGDYLREHLSGKRVRLVRDSSDRDRYGRLLRYVYTDDGELVNARLVREGLARAKSYAPDTALQNELWQAQRQAREARKGLWSDAKTDRQRR